MGVLSQASCYSALWQKIPFLPDPPTPGFNPVEWSSPQYRSYAKATLLSATAVSISFVGFAVVLNLFLFLWRLLGGLRLCCALCGVQARILRRKDLVSYKVMHDPWLLGHKIAFACFAIGCIALAASGLATLPRPKQQVEELADRVQAGSLYAAAMLAASDSLLRSASDMRPNMQQAQTAMQLQTVTESLQSDVQCISTLLDSARPDSWRAQIAATTPLLSTTLGTALDVAAMLVNATIAAAPTGSTTSMGVVEGMPALLATINGSLALYDAALAALAASWQPTSFSIPLIDALKAAQTTLNIPLWLSSLDLLHQSVMTVDAVSRNNHYVRLGDALKDVTLAAAAALSPLDTMRISLTALDTLYLGPQLPAQQPREATAPTASRPCLVSLAYELSDYDENAFRFNTSLERSAIATTQTTALALETMYGAPFPVVSSVSATATTATNSSMAIPTPLAAAPLQAAQLLEPLATANITRLTELCNLAQSMTTLRTGESLLGDVPHILSFLTELRRTLAALQQPISSVQAALEAFESGQSQILYESLLIATGTAKPPLGSARSAALGPLTPSFSMLATSAGKIMMLSNSTLISSSNSSGKSNSSSTLVTLDYWLRTTAGNLTLMRTKVAGGTGSSVAVLDSTFAGLDVIQRAQDQSLDLLVKSGWGNPSAAAEYGSGAAGDGNSSAPPAPLPAPAAPPARPSAIFQSLLLSMQGIQDVLSEGIAMVSEQLDNALGRALLAIPPLPPPPPRPPPIPPPPPTPTRPPRLPMRPVPPRPPSQSGARPPQSASSLSPTPVISSPLIMGVLAQPLTTLLPPQPPVIALPPPATPQALPIVTPLQSSLPLHLTTTPPPTTSHRHRRLQEFTSPSVTNVTTAVRRDVVHRLDKLATDLRSIALSKYMKAAYWTAVVVYACVIASCVLLVVAIYLNWPAGLVVALVLNLVLAGVILAAAWAAAAGMVVTHDFCGNLDSIVLDSISPSSPSFTLARFYLQEVGSGLVNVLRNAGLGDTWRLTNAASILQDQVLNPFLLPRPPNVTISSSANSDTTTRTSHLWPGSLGNVQYKLGEFLVTLSSLSMNVSAQLAALLKLSDRTAVLVQYRAVTSWACCGLGGQLLLVWISATGCGLMACLAALCGMMVLKNLDDMPVARHCGCTCYNQKDYPKPMSRRHMSSNGSLTTCSVFSSNNGLFNSGHGSSSRLLSGSHCASGIKSMALLPSVGDLPPSNSGRSALDRPVSLTAKSDGCGALPGCGETPETPHATLVESPLYQGALVSSSSTQDMPRPATGPRSRRRLDSIVWRQPGPPLNMFVLDSDTAQALSYEILNSRSNGGQEVMAPTRPPQPSPHAELFQRPSSSRPSPLRPAPSSRQQKLQD